ncbi:MAG TPA: site-specific integrase [Clostridia bacterium]|nr:site-specific integrase [Clostridia bacterium]
MPDKVNANSPADKAKSGWKHNGFEATEVPCLYRRRGPRGTMYYGRVKRHGKLYMSKLAADFKDAKVALRTWLSGVGSKAAQASTNGTKGVSTWGHFKDKFIRAIELDVALAPRSKQYRRECITRITKSWRGLFKEEIETRKISSITTEQVLTWGASVTGYYRGTYNNTIATMRMVFAEAIEAGYLLSNPAGKLKRIGKMPRTAQGCTVGEPGEDLTPEEKADLEQTLLDGDEQRWYPTPDEFKTIVAKMRSYKFGPTQAAAEFAELLYETGTRLSEAARLRWSDVDWSKNTLRINGSKGRAVSTESSIRHLPITTALAELLRRLEKVERAPNNRIARVLACRGTMQRACDDLELPRRIDHHDLRHSFATRYIARGVPVPVVARWLGHKDGGALLLRVYTHEDAAESQRWAKI